MILYGDYENDLNQQLADIARHDLREETRPRAEQAGPNNWDNLTDRDYGEHYDFEILEHGDDRWVYFPVCNAATQWAYRFLPEDCPRWQTGFIIDEPLNSYRSKTIMDKLWNDGLKIEWDRAAENDEQARQ